jgi:hypothetical protein
MAADAAGIYRQTMPQTSTSKLIQLCPSTGHYAGVEHLIIGFALLCQLGTAILHYQYHLPDVFFNVLLLGPELLKLR